MISDPVFLMNFIIYFKHLPYLLIVSDEFKKSLDQCRNEEYCKNLTVISVKIVGK